LQGNRKNIILGVISIICLVALVIIIFRSGKPVEVEYTGRQIGTEASAESELSEEQVKALAAKLPPEEPATRKPSALYPDERPNPKTANSEIAKIQAEAVKKNRESAMASRNTSTQSLSPEEKARLDQIREMRKKQAEKKKR